MLRKKMEQQKQKVETVAAKKGGVAGWRIPPKWLIII